MKRISNRQQDLVLVQAVAYPDEVVAPVIKYVDRHVEVPVIVEKVVEVEKRVEVEKLVEVQAPAADLSQVHEKLKNHKTSLDGLYNWNSKVVEELEMQRRALVGLKTQRDIDRSRRLMLIRRMKKEQQEHKKQMLKLKYMVYASIVISILSLLIKI